MADFLPVQAGSKLFCVIKAYPNFIAFDYHQSKRASVIIVGGECLTLNISCKNPLLEVKPVYYCKTHYLINECSQMTGLLMSDDGLKGLTESLKIIDTTLDLATLVSPLQCVKFLLFKVLLAYTLLVRHIFPLQYDELMV